MIKLVESPFFCKELEPVPGPSLPGHTSRAIDILVDENQYISYNSKNLHIPNELRNLLDLRQRPPVYTPAGSPGRSPQPSDRLYYENNWPFARTLLCRRFVKDVTPENLQTLEDPCLKDFQEFLHLSHFQDRLSFSYLRGQTTSDGRLLAGADTNADRLLYHFGFDWVALARGSPPTDSEIVRRLKATAGPDQFIVRRRTCIAAILRTTNAHRLHDQSLCPSSWASKTVLQYRRTLILFNELSSSQDKIPFHDWLSPQAEGEQLWSSGSTADGGMDTPESALHFICTLLERILLRVIEDFKFVLDAAADHITALESRVTHSLPVDDLEDMAQDTWLDSQIWATLRKLLGAQRESLLETGNTLRSLKVKIKLSKDGDGHPFQHLLDDLESLQTTLSQDFGEHSQKMSDLVYNIINIRIAQSSQADSISLGRISWISFVFFPLVMVSGLFGMNVDVLADNPSIKWYFIVAVPFTLVVLALAFLIQKAPALRDRLRS